MFMRFAMFLYFFLKSWHRGASCFGGHKGGSNNSTPNNERNMCPSNHRVKEEGSSWWLYTHQFLPGAKKEKCVRLNYCVCIGMCVCVYVSVYVCVQRRPVTKVKMQFSFPRSFIHGENKVIISVTITTTRCKLTPNPLPLFLLSA